MSKRGRDHLCPDWLISLQLYPKMGGQKCRDPGFGPGIPGSYINFIVKIRMYAHFCTIASLTCTWGPWVKPVHRQQIFFDRQNFKFNLIQICWTKLKLSFSIRIKWMLNAKSELKSPFGSLLSCSFLNSNYYSYFNCRRIINKKNGTEFENFYNWSLYSTWRLLRNRENNTSN